MLTPMQHPCNATQQYFTTCLTDFFYRCKVLPGNQSAHQGDWKALADGTKWIAEVGTKAQPFFAYQGFNIVHPDYNTSQVHSSRKKMVTNPVDKFAD